MNKATKPRRRRLRKLIWFLLILLILAGIGFYAYSALRAEYTVTYDSYTATTGSISNALSFSGNLSLIDSASYSAPADTSVRRLCVAAGDRVSDGDELMRLSNGTTIKAEFDGTVNVLSVKEGDDVAYYTAQCNVDVDGDVIYVESEKDTSASGLSGLLSGLFGRQRFNAAQSGGMNRGVMPSFGDGGMPNFGDASSGGMNRGERSQMGGGPQ